MSGEEWEGSRGRSSRLRSGPDCASSLPWSFGHITSLLYVWTITCKRGWGGVMSSLYLTGFSEKQEKGTQLAGRKKISDSSLQLCICSWDFLLVVVSLEPSLTSVLSGYLRKLPQKLKLKKKQIKETLRSYYYLWEDPQGRRPALSGSLSSCMYPLGEQGIE